MTELPVMTNRLHLDLLIGGEFEPGDGARMAELVRRLAGDEVLRERLRAGGLQTADRYTLERFADGTVAEMLAAVRR